VETRRLTTASFKSKRSPSGLLTITNTMSNPNILAELKRAATALEARGAAPIAAGSTHGRYLWRACVMSLTGFGPAWTREGGHRRRSRLALTPDLLRAAAAQLVGTPVRRWIAPDGGTWDHPPNASDPWPDTHVGEVKLVGVADDSIMADLAIDAGFPAELEAIARAGRLWVSAGVSLTMIFRGPDVEPSPGPDGEPVSYFTYGEGAEIKVISVDVVNRKPSTDGAHILGLVGREA
jgi:hypothetical protein